MDSKLTKKMDQHEADVPNSGPENNMDRWGNRVGREGFANGVIGFGWLGLHVF